MTAAEPDFVKGASGPSQGVQLASPGLNYLGGATATATSSSSGAAGTAFPSTPANGDLFIYTADGTAGVFWSFVWYDAGSYWGFVGGSPLFAEVTAAESTSSLTYVALGTAGPSITAPLKGDYYVAINFGAQNATSFTNQEQMRMSYDIGGTGAADADSAYGGVKGTIVSPYRVRLQTGIAANTAFVSKYKSYGDSIQFYNRTMQIWPVKHTP